MLEFLGEVWNAIGAALTLNVASVQALITPGIPGDSPVGVMLSVAILAGASQLLGDSVVLFVNRVRPIRFLVTLLVNGLLFVLELFIWSLTIWFTASIIYQQARPPGDVFLLVCLGSAPLVFAFLVFLPYLGELLRWLLRIYSWIITLVLVGVEYQFGVFPALVCTLGGWLLIELARRLLSGPLRTLHDQVWQRAMGTPGIATFDDQIEVLNRTLQQEITPHSIG